MMTPRQGAALALLVLACAFIVSLMTGCDDRQTVHCQDGTTSTGTNVDPHLCDEHGGRVP